MAFSQNQAFPSLSITVPGCTVVRVNGVDLGISDAEDMVSFSDHHERYEVHSDESGPILPAKIIGHGRWCLINCPVILYDQSAIYDTIVEAGDTDIGTLGSLGLDVPYFPVSIVPRISGSVGYTFPYCFLQNEPIQVTGWGNKEEKWLLTFKAIPDPNNLSDPTQPVYTTDYV